MTSWRPAHSPRVEQAALRSLQSELTALSNVRLAVVDSRAAGAMLDLQVLVAEIAQEAGPVAERRTLKIEFRGDPSTPLLDSQPGAHTQGARGPDRVLHAPQ